MESAKRTRLTEGPAVLADALRVLLLRASDFLCGAPLQQTLVALSVTSSSIRRVVLRWLHGRLSNDITRQHEDRAIAVRWRNESDSTEALIRLMRFIYVTEVQIPVPREAHALPVESRRQLLESDAHVRAIVQERNVDLYASYNHASGWGIYAAESIAAGEYLGEYTGELISMAEARRRYAEMYDRTRTNYVLALREQGKDEDTTVVVRTNVDATADGCYTRFYNHGCDPTLRVEAVRVDSFIPRLVFFARRAISYGEQLTFDYGSVDTELMRQVRPAQRQAGMIRCECGAHSCRLYLPSDMSL